MSFAFTVDTVTNKLLAVGHGLAAGARLALEVDDADNDTLPLPLQPKASRARYFVRDVEVDAFRVAYYDGGAAIDLLSAGVGTFAAEEVRIVSAMDALFEDVATYFAALGRAEVLAWGGDELTKQINQSAATRAGRVVWVPGDDSGKFGKLRQATGLSRRPRQIATFEELATVHIWARDPAASRGDERAHYRACWDLFELVLRAVRSSACGRVVLGDPEVVKEPVEQVFGFALVLPLSIVGGVVEEAPAVVRASVSWTSSQLDGQGGETVVE